VNLAEYQRMYDAEERQWWYAGMRALSLALLAGPLADPHSSQLVMALHDPNVVTSPSALSDVLSHIPSQFLALVKPFVDMYIELSKTSVANAIAMLAAPSIVPVRIEV